VVVGVVADPSRAAGLPNGTDVVAGNKIFYTIETFQATYNTKIKLTYFGQFLIKKLYIVGKIQISF